MSGISSILNSYGSGGTSSIDQLINMTLQKDVQPITDLEKEKSNLQSRLNIFNQLRTRLTALNDRVKNYQKATDLPALAALRATVSNEKVVKAEITSGSASAGVTSVQVTRLASRDMAVSDKITNLTAATLAQQFNGTTQQIRLKIGADGDPLVLDIAFTDPAETNESVMRRVIDAMNDAGLEMSASFLRDSSSSGRITVTSNETGLENKLILRDKTGSSLLEALGFHSGDNTRRAADGNTGGFIVAAAADLDASAVINGIAVTSSSNTLSEVIDGLSIELLAAQNPDEAPVTISVEQDSSKVKEEIESFLKEYNAVITYLNEQSKVDTTTFERGPLAGNFTFINLRLNLRNSIVSPVTSSPAGSPFLMSELGISTDRDGTLSIKDATKFTEAIEENPLALQNLFLGENGIASKVQGILDQFASTGGLVDDNKKAVTRRIASIDTRIDRMESQLTLRESQLRQQYTNLQRTLSALQSQQSTISQINSMFSTTQSGGLSF